ncbi:hypothetical protein [Cellulomonas iranensis]|uniref:Uncharacterized protein n=1 Tax=Cellulomonas iranensis TaxID=76862 RepID=A0ABU0GKZ8_9CELL|nr:hypothetical protein [Cellulomonas iranensis]MDQ0426026.1 hypothetical protein [Cellulomonas iranensis]
MRKVAPDLTLALAQPAPTVPGERTALRTIDGIPPAACPTEEVTVTTTPTALDHEPVIALSGHRRRRHLKQLLRTRDRLAVLATERFSHALDDASDTFALMIEVEDEIADLFPDVHAALFHRWISIDAVAGHEPGSHNTRCGLCVTRGDNRGLPAAA